MEDVGCCGDEESMKKCAPTAYATANTVAGITNAAFIVAVAVVASYGWDDVHSFQIAAGVVGIVLGAFGVAEFFYNASMRDGLNGVVYMLRVVLTVGGLFMLITTMAEGHNAEGTPGSLIGGHSQLLAASLFGVGLVVFGMSGYSEF